MTWLTAWLADPTGIAVQGLLSLTIVLFGLGAFAAIRDSTFSLKYVDAFVRSTVAGKVLPAALVLLVGWLAQNMLLIALGTAFALTVTAGMLAAIKDSLLQLGMSKAASAKLNETPS